MDYEIVWTGSMERQATEAARRSAVVLPSHRQPIMAGDMNTNQRVMAYVQRFPDSTWVQITDAIGATKAAVNGALYRLMELGYVSRSHSQKENRQQRIRWRVT
jgi:hypothetical protein